MAKEYDEPFLLQVNIHPDQSITNFIVEPYWDDEVLEMRYVVKFDNMEVGTLHLVDIHEWEWINCELQESARLPLAAELSRLIEIRDN